MSGLCFLEKVENKFTYFHNLVYKNILRILVRKEGKK